MTPPDPHITIVLDAMGGDFAPANEVRGTAAALAEAPGRFHVVLVGQEERIRADLDTVQREGHAVNREALSVVHAPEIITMDDGPTAALKTKKQSSLAVGLELQKQGHAHAFVSAGNTGAVLSASTLILGRVQGVGRPTIGALIPTTKRPSLLLDAGANVDCKPRHLFEFGAMGSIYMSAIEGVQEPTIGLLNVGEEESKGNETALEAYRLFKKSRFNFVGNVEGRDVLKGEVNVIVCDGFVGNILLKFGESIPSFLKSRFTTFAAQSLKNKAIALVARNSLRGVLRELDYQEHGGVPLLGVNGVTIIGHGRSTPKAITNMIFRAEEMVRNDVNGQIRKTLGTFHE